MSTLELRDLISQKLNVIKDISFLQSINTLIEAELDGKIYHLSGEQKRRIAEAEVEYLAGNSISEEQLEAEVEKWV